jgi:hypothetical protein
LVAAAATRQCQAAAEEPPASDKGHIHQTKPPKRAAPGETKAQESGPNLLGIIAVICFALAATVGPKSLSKRSNQLANIPNETTFPKDQRGYCA